jgi:hypothetical protein
MGRHKVSGTAYKRHAETMASMLEESSFISNKVVRRHFRIARASWLQTPDGSLRMTKFNLRWHESEV